MLPAAVGVCCYYAVLKPVYGVNRHKKVQYKPKKFKNKDVFIQNKAVFLKNKDEKL